MTDTFFDYDDNKKKDKAEAAVKKLNELLEPHATNRLNRLMSALQKFNEDYANTSTSAKATWFAGNGKQEK